MFSSIIQVRLLSILTCDAYQFRKRHGSDGDAFTEMFRSVRGWYCCHLVSQEHQRNFQFWESQVAGLKSAERWTLTVEYLSWRHRHAQALHNRWQVFKLTQCNFWSEIMTKILCSAWSDKEIRQCWQILVLYMSNSKPWRWILTSNYILLTSFVTEWTFDLGHQLNSRRHGQAVANFAALVEVQRRQVLFQHTIPNLITWNPFIDVETLRVQSSGILV